LLENLMAKASGAIALYHVLERAGIEASEVDFILSCSEEAVGDRYNRGGGSLSKAIGEMCHCVNATGHDIKAFCAAPIHAIMDAACLVQAGVFERVVVVGGGCLAKIGMKYVGHLKHNMPILEDVLAGFAFLITPDDGISPVVRLDCVGKHDIGSLKILADIVEPVKFYTRPNTHEYTQMTPLNRLVDAARPESHKARQFRDMVDEMLADAPNYRINRQIIREWLIEWRDNNEKLRPILEDSVLLKEIIPLSEDVASLADVGLQALNYIENEQKPPQSWLEGLSSLLDRPQKPEYEMQIMIVPAISKLVEAAQPPLISDDFEDGNAQAWKPNVPENWRVAEEDGSLVYRLIAPGPPGAVRAPTSWSILKDFDVTDFVFTGRLKCRAETNNIYRSVVIVFHYQDPIHFYYAHFAAISDKVHNIIGLVNGKDRVKINREPLGQSIPRLKDLKFHDFKVIYDAETGEIKAFLDDMTTPILTANDKTLNHGFVGVGSFDDTGSYDDIKLWGKIFR